ncbi:MAG: choice-of-anchor B family protein [Bacteroidetes bacterium]|nr:choice-of-anchor B family protein [Bacteroidota bacterium]
MYTRLVFAAFFLFSSLGIVAQTPCVNGMAGPYPCENINLLSFVENGDLGGGSMNDIWGWVDPLDSAEYVLLGRTSGTSFLDITDPVNPIYLGDLPTATLNSTWRDIKVYNNYAFIVSEAGQHGMQIFDLTNLRDIASPPLLFEEDAHYSGWGNAHNIVINESTGRAYGVGTNTFNGGLHIVDISDPLNPTLIGDFSEDGYTHDAQVVSYAGPDTNFQGKEIAFACNENTVTIADVTDASNTTLISSTGYPGASYTHQGWLTEDHRYFLSNDELDEQGSGINTTTFIWDMLDLSAPLIIGTFVSSTSAIDHNLYTHNGYVYQSNYRAGLRILDTENIADAILEEVAYFDVYPSSNSAQFDGTWSNYPYFPSGVIAVSHIGEGLFLLGLSGELSDLGCTDIEACNYDASALEDDGTCIGFNICGGCENEELFCVGCTDLAACNYSLDATIDDSTCFIISPPMPQTIIQEEVGVVFQNGPGSFWYESETASDPISNSDSLEMDFELFSQTVWVANSNGEWNAVGGEEEPDFNNGQYHDNNAYWLKFDVFEPVVFESVDVYSEQANMHSILIIDTDGTVFSEVFQELDEGWNEFILNVELPSGEGYGLRAGNNVPLLWRDAPNADLNYPYEIGSLASIVSTSGSNNSQYSYYYYFYNWRMHSADPCISERVEFNVTFDPSYNIENVDQEVNRTLVKIVDYLGREVNEVLGQIVFYIYDDGSAKKVFVVD